jgi:hypothetical protein
MRASMPAVYTRPLTGGEPSMPSPAQPLTLFERVEIRVGIE